MIRRLFLSWFCVFFLGTVIARVELRSTSASSKIGREVTPNVGHEHLNSSQRSQPNASAFLHAGALGVPLLDKNNDELEYPRCNIIRCDPIEDVGSLPNRVHQHSRRGLERKPWANASTLDFTRRYLSSKKPRPWYLRIDESRNLIYPNLRLVMLSGASEPALPNDLWPVIEEKAALQVFRVFSPKLLWNVLLSLYRDKSYSGPRIHAEAPHKNETTADLFAAVVFYKLADRLFGRNEDAEGAGITTFGDTGALREDLLVNVTSIQLFLNDTQYKAEGYDWTAMTRRQAQTVLSLMKATEDQFTEVSAKYGQVFDQSQSNGSNEPSDGTNLKFKAVEVHKSTMRALENAIAEASTVFKNPYSDSYGFQRGKFAGSVSLYA